MGYNEEIIDLSVKTGIEAYAIELLQQACDSKVQRLKTYFFKIHYPDDNQFGPLLSLPSGKIVELPGVCASVDYTSRYEIVEHLNQNEFFKSKKLMAFISEGMLPNEQSGIGLIQSETQFEILRMQRTCFLRTESNTEFIITILKEIDQRYGIKIWGADIDWCEIELISEPNDWEFFTKKMYQINPEMFDLEEDFGELIEVEKAIEFLRTILLQRKKRIILWWD